MKLIAGKKPWRDQELKGGPARGRVGDPVLGALIRARLRLPRKRTRAPASAGDGHTVDDTASALDSADLTNPAGQPHRTTHSEQPRPLKHGTAGYSRESLVD